MKRLAALLCVIGLGCGQRINQEKSVTLEAGDIKAIILDAPTKEQKIAVEFTSSDAPVDLLIIRGNDEKTVLAELEKASPKLEVAARKEKSKGDTVEATIPPGQDFGIYLRNAAKKTTVTVKIRSR